MPIPARQKKPGEKKTLTFNFSPKLATGDGLVGLPTITSDLTTSNAQRVGDRVSVRVEGGNEGMDYNVKVECDTGLGDRLQLDAVIEIRESAN